MAATVSSAIGRQDHHRITPTARLVAYLRSFSDIPYAKETSQALRGEEAARELYRDDLDTVTRFSGPFAEARYKCFGRFIDPCSNVMELAIGTSIERGLAISDDPDSVYVGTDLPEMIEDAKAFFHQINRKARVNHHLAAANVLSYEELTAASSHLGARGDLVIIHEGLWMYLTAEEKAVCAENIRRILQQRGGIWVTPDISDLESTKQLIRSLDSEMRLATARVMQRSLDLTGRDIEKNYFANNEEALAFLRNSGFNATSYPMIDDPARLTSITKLWGERERRFYEPPLRQQKVWVISLR